MSEFSALSKIKLCINGHGHGHGHVLSNLEAANEPFGQSYPALYMQPSLIIRPKIFWTIEGADCRDRNGVADAWCAKCASCFLRINTMGMKCSSDGVQ